ncbi:hypothetical protein [Geomonas propionica]|uniref:Small CPxCG-related zinc finger protein n=1 Tax=Geomonas propionica TaxID=2798582 RepID=A0ABS0YXL6_9BACT|nr:hypothetical protein [Geomonas propionica]MBJ6802721.1 hypothetical protein [Geomonas propionica]
MTDPLEDLLAFLYATEDETVSCSRCGRNLAEGEEYGFDANGEPHCPECSDPEEEE